MACTFGEREVEERREEMKRRVYSRDELDTKIKKINNFMCNHLD